jgi:hypothetical protein
MREALQRWAQHVAALPAQRAGRADTVISGASLARPGFTHEAARAHP